MCDKFKEMGIENEAQVVQISGQPGYTTAIERSRRASMTVCPKSARM
jgi:ribose transport system substrate-binding protein